MPDKYYLTKERLTELQEELRLLKSEKRLEIADRLKRAKEYGDLSENSEYAEAREEQSKIEARIFELEEALRKAVIIEASSGNDKVVVGCKVHVKRDGKTFEYMIVGSSESKPEEGKISNDSPIGRALLGHQVGESVFVETPAGKATYQITKID